MPRVEFFFFPTGFIQTFLTSFLEALFFLFDFDVLMRSPLPQHELQSKKKRKKKENESLINYFILTFEAESSKDTEKRFS